MIQKQKDDEDKTPDQAPGETPFLQKLTGSPGAQDVSRVAQGGEPETDNHDVIKEAEAAYQRRYGEDMDDDKPLELKDTSDIRQAYAQLFDSLAKIISC